MILSALFHFENFKYICSGCKCSSQKKKQSGSDSNKMFGSLQMLKLRAVTFTCLQKMIKKIQHVHCSESVPQTLCKPCCNVLLQIRIYCEKSLNPPLAPSVPPSSIYFMSNIPGREDIESVSSSADISKYWLSCKIR